MRQFKLLFLALVLALITGCAYGFKGISIPPDVNTFSVDNFALSVSAAPQGIEVLFAETLRDKVRNESRLKYNSDNPDIIFSGSIVTYNISAQSPEEGSVVAFNKLTIGIKVNYDSLLNEEDSWTKSFNFYADFDSSEDISTIETELVETIYEQLVENIFNDSFTDW